MFPDEVAARGWDAIDVLLVTGDAYVDHPAFGASVIGRVLEARGFRVGIVAQPRLATRPSDLLRLGRPRLFVGITAGAMDSLVNHYTAHKRPRSDDAYTPGRRGGPAARPGGDGLRAAGAPGLRADHAHRDRRGRGLAPAHRPLRLLGRPGAAVGPRATAAPTCSSTGRGRSPSSRSPGGSPRARTSAASSTCRAPRWRWPTWPWPASTGGPAKTLVLPAFEEVAQDKRTFAFFSKLYHLEHNHENARVMVQRHGRGRAERHVVVNEPMPPPTTEELDADRTSCPSSARPTRATAGPTSRRWSRSAGAWPSCAAAPPAAPSAASPSTRGATCPRRSHGERDPRDRDPHEGPEVPRHHHRPGRGHRQHVADGLHQRRGPRRLPAGLLRLPHRLPVLRGGPRAARRPLPRCTRGEGREARLRRLRAALRPGPRRQEERAALPRGARRPPRLRASSRWRPSTSATTCSR